MPRKLDDTTFSYMNAEESPDSIEQGGRCKPSVVRPS